MDTALENGDFCLGPNGRPVRISGEQELLQRAMIRLNVPLGGFDYDAALGSRLHTLETGAADFNEKAAEMAQEALRQLAEFTVSGVRRPADKPGTVMVQLSYNGKTAEIEVKL